MDELRRPFLLAAVALLAVAVLVEVGAAGVLRRGPVPAGELRRLAFEEAARSDDDDFDADDAEDALPELEALSREHRPPGRGVPYLALLDAILLYAAGMMALSLVVPRGLQGRVQGVAGLVFSIVLVIAAVVAILVAFALLLVMTALLLSAPFGTIAYFAVYAFFDRTGASVALSLVLALKLGFAACLVLAQQRFVRNRSLVLLTLTSLLANVVVAFLHGLVPLFLVSITDAIAAIVVGILAVVWAVVMIVASVVAIVKLAL